MHTCSACHARVRPIRPNPLWILVAIVVAPIVLISFMLLAVMQPIGMVAAPLYFAFLMFPIVGLAEKLTAKPRCPKCRKIFVPSPQVREERELVGSSAIQTP